MECPHLGGHFYLVEEVDYRNDYAPEIRIIAEDYSIPQTNKTRR